MSRIYRGVGDPNFYCDGTNRGRCPVCNKNECIAELEAERNNAGNANAKLWSENSKLLLDNTRLREALDLIVNMDNHMASLGDACGVALRALEGE